MPIVKKLFFAPLFLLLLTLTIYQIVPFLINKELLFSLDLSVGISLIILSLSIILTSLFFIVFATIASDWKIILPICALSILPQAILIPFPLGILSGLFTSILLFLVYLNFDSVLRTYINFKPSNLLTPSVKSLSSLLTLALCLIYFLSMSALIKQEGFQIPNQLIEYASEFSPEQSLNTSGTDSELVNPQAENLIKDAIKDQFQTMIDPYVSYLPTLLSILLFFTLKSIQSLLSVLVGPAVSLIFYILEKTGYITFTKEMREVKKMVV